METEATAAATPGTKKRRTEASQREEPGEIVSPPSQSDLKPRLSAGALHPDPTSHGEEPPPGTGGGGGDDVDRISTLPDAILGEIISLLPTKDGARTQTLASRWRHLWLSAPLNIDHSSMPTGHEAQAGIISRILAAHSGPARRFSVPNFHLYYRKATVDAWLRSPALDRLQELEFNDGGWNTWQSLPASAFRFTATLCVFTMSRCSLLDETVKTFRFPQLRQLALVYMEISDVALHGITSASACPVLEYLLINGCSVHCLRINSPSLKSIAMSSGEVIIEDAPLLQRLFQLQTGLDISVISAPKLETLGCLDYDSKLVFGTTVIQKLCAVSFTAVVCSVRILAIYMYDLNLDMVINLLRCFPCLERLYIEPSGRKGTNYFSITNPDLIRCKNLWRRKLCDLIRCLDIRLKKIVLKNYRGIKSEVNFASFFVLNAKMLELMRFQIGEYNDNEKFIAEQRRSLHLEKRASRHAQFYFTTGCEKYRHNLSQFAHINRVSDLSIIDPF
ncbi:unnamed protein product [Urochloa decumbens]|uniref:FBD domain-containing protein n=1 Tax=Urochloa decumbens TaxID=240449 RepID=A0ABC9E975_9POAL